MLNKKQLDKVKASLPPHGYKLIAEEIGSATEISVKLAMSTPERFKNRTDIAAAIVKVMADYKKNQSNNAKKVMSAIK